MRIAALVVAVALGVLVAGWPEFVVPARLAAPVAVDLGGGRRVVDGADGAVGVEGFASADEAPVRIAPIEVVVRAADRDTRAAVAVYVALLAAAFAAFVRAVLVQHRNRRRLGAITSLAVVAGWFALPEVLSRTLDAPVGVRSVPFTAWWSLAAALLMLGTLLALDLQPAPRNRSRARNG